VSVLHVGIVVTLDGESWEIFHEVDVPPSYTEQDIDPFIRHEMDKAVAALQREEFGEARSAEIIEQFDRRISLIRRLLRLAPHSIRNAAVARRIKEVIEMDRAQLYARFGREDMGD
jgi:5-methylthioribose kinase